jgi:putative spermidine/putrescine transport system substrate-binding protein
MSAISPHYFWNCLAVASVCVSPAHAQTVPAVTEIRMLESGGLSGDSVEQAYIKPFTEKTGIKVVRESPTGTGKLQAMVQSKNVTATLVELSATNAIQARVLGLIEPLDWAAIDPAPMFPEAKWPDGFGWQYFSTVMVWGKTTKPLASWADFWNVKEFPGKRALPDYPTFTLPLALLADGVKPENLYPLDLDRAFSSLRKIKGSVAVWWKAGGQPSQLLEDQEVAYAAAWSGRVVGSPKLKYTYNQGLLQLSYFVVPKGADPASKAAAMILLREMSLLKNQSVASAVVPYTGASPGIEKYIAKERVDDYPTSAANRKIQVLVDPHWTAENAKLIEKRWQEFKLSL